MDIDLGPVPDWLVLDAVRYAFGRMTGQVFTTCNWLVAHWDRLPEGLRALIRRDLEEVFRRDDDSRTHHRVGETLVVRPLGMDCDRDQWERVRRLWADPEVP